ncbi:MAG: ribonuclease HII [Candidatus Omnitrophota bacterium]
MRKSGRSAIPGKMLYHERKARRAGFARIAGVDEAGRGPLAGPVVAACVMLERSDFRNRIDDSKVLTAKARVRAYCEIEEKAVYGVGVVDRDVIDDINIYWATALAMKKAVENLAHEPDFLLIDGRIKLDLPFSARCIIKGDSRSVSIACASIIAKVTRDRIMEEYDGVYPEYGFGRHKGYGTKAHNEALRKYGPSPIHRFSFRPVSAVKHLTD